MQNTANMPEIGEMRITVTEQQIDQSIITLLEDQIQEVSRLRAAEREASDEYDSAYQEFITANGKLIENREKAKVERLQAENKLRELTLQAYAATGSKKPVEGVGIRVQKVLTYDEAKALHWCVSNQYLNCLQLNKANFKKVAEGLGPDFVEIAEMPQATISKEL